MKLFTPKISLVESTANFMGAEYSLGQKDCFGIILDYLDNRGINYPQEYKGLTRESYKELYLKEPEQAKKIMIAYIEDNFKEVDIKENRPGFILLISHKDRISLAINGGNATAIFATEKMGVIKLPIKYYKLLRVWRPELCPKSFH